MSKPFKDITGKKFGRLTALYRLKKGYTIERALELEVK